MGGTVMIAQPVLSTTLLSGTVVSELWEQFCQLPDEAGTVTGTVMLRAPLSANPPLYVQDTVVVVDALQSQPAPVGVPAIVFLVNIEPKSMLFLFTTLFRSVFSLVTVSV